MSTPKILAFSGSTRKESINAQLVARASALASERGADVTTISLTDYDMPIYNGDLEESEGIPDAAMRLKKLFKETDGVIVACPEYNGSITPLLKNTIDWVSRQADGETPLECYRGKVVGLVAASPGGLGGIRGLAHVRTILSGIGAHVIPTQVAIGKGFEAFADDGSLKNEQQAKMLDGFADQIVRTTTALSQ